MSASWEPLNTALFSDLPQSNFKCVQHCSDRVSQSQAIVKRLPVSRIKPFFLKTDIKILELQAWCINPGWDQRPFSLQSPQRNQRWGTRHVQLPGRRVTGTPEGDVKTGPEACCRAPALPSHLPPETALNCGVRMELHRVSGWMFTFLQCNSISAFLDTKRTDMQETPSMISSAWCSSVWEQV